MGRIGEVVVRVRPALRFGGALGVGIFAVGIWWGAVAAIATGEADWPIRSMHPGTVGVVVLWVILIPVGIGLSYLALFLLFQKQTFGADGATVRKVVRTWRLPLASLTKVEFQGYSIHTGTAQLPAQRLLVHSDAAGRYPLRALLQGGLTHVNEAFEVVEGWVRLRPELVRGTSAEDYFVERGVLTSRSSDVPDQSS